MKRKNKNARNKLVIGVFLVIALILAVVLLSGNLFVAAESITLNDPEMIWNGRVIVEDSCVVQDVLSVRKKPSLHTTRPGQAIRQSL